MSTLIAFEEDLTLNGIEVEILPLPITDLSVKFMYRFSQPMALSLSHEPIVIRINLDDLRSVEELLAVALSDEYKLLLKESGINFVGDLKVKLVDLKLVREDKPY